jgi:PKD repeat protein
MMATKAKLVSFVLLLALVATPVAGCAGNLPPIADFIYSPSSPNTGASILFTDNSTDDGFIASWDWDFGDGSTSTTQNPTHSFAAAGTYAVSLTVTDDGGATDSYTVNITVTSLPEIGAWDAIEILVGEIIPPASAYERISAFMLSEPLQAGDVVSSLDGTDYPVNTNTWFIFIDDMPEAGYAHDTRYVFIDAVTTDYDIFNESWPPLINGFSMWNAQNLNRGHLIELWSILDNPAPIASGTTDAPSGDYGDAPDGQVELYYGITAHFPTLFNTTNSHFGRPGGHTLNVGEETLGLNVSAEVDAIDPNDPDGVPNLVDADSDERIYVIMEGTKASLAFTVTVSPAAPDMTRHANVLIDFDQSGNWSTGNYGTEWVVVNLDVDVDPGDSETIITPEFYWSNQLVPPTEVWMRVALTRAEVDEALFANVGGWDGSGQYAYGEIEDHFVFLIDNPPPPPDGDGDGQPPTPPPPGPPNGPCGYEINYYVLIINCGDSPDHLGKGTPYMQASADRMTALANAQGYTSIGNLSPNKSGASQTSWANISKAFDDLAKVVQCGDYVLIYICGHGHPDGGIAIANSAGALQGWLLPTDLANFLAKIPACPDEDCNTKGKCCHVSVEIESCFAGNFNVPGVTGQGRSVSGAANTNECWLTYPGGGVYTQGLDRDLRDLASDTNHDGSVDPVEAHASAYAAVQDYHRNRSTTQKPWNNNQWCLCKCPCQPGIDVEKWIWYDQYETWVDEIEVEPGAMVDFVLEIESSGNCRDIIDIVIIDYLPYCLDFVPGSFFLYYNGVPIGSRPPDEINQEAEGAELIWYLEEIDSLSPGEFVSIEYHAYAIYPGANVNWLYGSAHCSYDYENVVSDQDSATVWVQQEPIEEEVLYGELYVEYYCYCEDSYCSYCNLYAEFFAEDISALLGPYPVTNVVLYLNGMKVFDSGLINTTYYSNSYSLPQAACNTYYYFTMIATNSIGLTVTVNKSFTTPLYCQ